MGSTTRKWVGGSVMAGLILASTCMPMVAMALSYHAGSHERTPFAFPVPMHHMVDTSTATSATAR